MLWHCWLGGRKDIRPVKNMGGWWRWVLVSPDGVAPSRMVGVSASVNLPLHHKVRSSLLAPADPGGAGKRAPKRLWWWWRQWTVENSVFGTVSLVFCLCMKYLRNRWTDLHQIHTEDVFGPSLGRGWRSQSKIKVTRDKSVIFQPFRRLACGFCLVKHLWPLVFFCSSHPWATEPHVCVIE